MEYQGIKLDWSDTSTQYVPVEDDIEFGIRKISYCQTPPRVYLPKLLLKLWNINKLNKVVYLKDEILYRTPQENAHIKNITIPNDQDTGYLLLPQDLYLKYKSATHIKFKGCKEKVELTFLKKQ